MTTIPSARREPSWVQGEGGTEGETLLGGVWGKKKPLVRPGSSWTSYRRNPAGSVAPCRIGTKRMLEILTRITEGEGQPADLDALLELAYTVMDLSLCGLGQTAPNPVLSTIRHFRHEYEAHIRDRTLSGQGVQRLAHIHHHPREVHWLWSMRPQLPRQLHQRSAEGGPRNRSDPLHQVQHMPCEVPLRSHCEELGAKGSEIIEADIP